MQYCKDALKLFGEKLNCDSPCPILKKCPRLIMEDAADIAIDKAIGAMIKAMRKEKSNKKSGG